MGRESGTSPTYSLCDGPQLRVTIWSLVTGLSTYVQFPIHPDRGMEFCLLYTQDIIDVDTGYAFRADGRYFVVAERHKSKDTLGVYDTTESYKLVRVRCTSLPWNLLSCFYG